MSAYKVATQPDIKSEQRSKIARSLPSKLLSTSSPWVVVPDGSFSGYFDWVPINLRVGPWNLFAPICIVVTLVAVIWSKPDTLEQSHHPDLPSTHSFFWYYNFVTFLYMVGLLITMIRGRGGFFIFSTYTIQSWALLALRHGLTAYSPYLPEKHFLMRLNELLRFQALNTATVTFVIWNFFVMPFVAIKGFSSKEKRVNFLKWAFSFKLVQIHLLNIVFAAMNAVITIKPSHSRYFTQEDLWFSFLHMMGYALFYLLVLDRLGVHLYPIFSPRSPFFVLTWMLGLGCHYASYLFWNWIIEHMDS